MIRRRDVIFAFALATAAILFIVAVFGWETYRETATLIFPPAFVVGLILWVAFIWRRN